MPSPTPLKVPPKWPKKFGTCLPKDLHHKFISWSGMQVGGISRMHDVWETLRRGPSQLPTRPSRVQTLPATRSRLPKALHPATRTGTPQPSPLCQGVTKKFDALPQKIAQKNGMLALKLKQKFRPYFRDLWGSWDTGADAGEMSHLMTTKSGIFLRGIFSSQAFAKSQ